MGSRHRHDPGDLGNLFSEAAFDAHVEGQVRAGAAVAGPMKPDLHFTLVGDVDQLDIAPIALDRRADKVDHALNALAEVGGGGGIHQMVRRIISATAMNVAEANIASDGSHLFKSEGEALPEPRLSNKIRLGRSPPRAYMKVRYNVAVQRVWKGGSWFFLMILVLAGATWVRSCRSPWTGGMISSDPAGRTGQIIQVDVWDGALNVYLDRFAFANAGDTKGWEAYRTSRFDWSVAGLFRDTRQMTAPTGNDLPPLLSRLGFKSCTVISPNEGDWAGRLIYFSARHSYLSVPWWFVCLVLIPPSIPALRRVMVTVFSRRCARCCGAVRRRRKCMTCGAPPEGIHTGWRSRIAFSGCLVLGFAIMALWAWSWLEVDMFQLGWRSDQWAARVVRMDLAQGKLFLSFRNYSAGVHDPFASATLSEFVYTPFFISMPEVSGFHRMAGLGGFGFVRTGWEVANHTEFHVTEIKAQIPQWIMVLLAVTFPARKILRAWNWRRIHGVIPDGICKKCGYDLTGNTSGICPECGKAITAKNPASAGLVKNSSAPAAHP
jgi:hypothetical protein